MWRKCILLLCILGYTVSGADSRHSHQTRSVRPRRDFPRAGRQVDGNGIDFSNAVFDEQTGKRCVIKEESVQSLEKSPILECVHKESEQCHYTYITKFTPAQEEVCEENFEKQCQITFKQQAVNETVQKCYKPIVKVCNGEGEEICQTVYESSCSTKYIEKQPGKFVGDTSCEKLPVKVCGAGCTFQEGPQECHDKVLVSLLDVPEEVCDLNPQKTCRLQTKLVPKLTPEHQCTRVPREICTLRFTTPQQITKPLLTKWCLDDSPVVKGELYDESNAMAAPLPREVERTIQDVGRFVQRNRLSFDLNTEKTFQDLGQSISSQRAFEKLGQNVQSLKDSGDIQYLNEIPDPTLKAEPELILHKTEIISRESEQLVREPHQIINQETFQLLEPEIRELPEELTPELEFEELDPELRNPLLKPILETGNLEQELRTQEIKLINQADALITEQPELITENPEQIELINDNEKLLTLGMQENNLNPEKQISLNPEQQVSTNPEKQVSQNPEQIKQDELLQHKMDLILEAEELNRELKALRLEALAMDKSELKNLDLDIDLEKSLLNQDTSFFNPDTDLVNPDTDKVNPDKNLLKEDELNSSSLAILSSSDDEDFLTNFKTQEFADFVDFSHL